MRTGTGYIKTDEPDPENQTGGQKLYDKYFMLRKRYDEEKDV